MNRETIQYYQDLSQKKPPEDALRMSPALARQRVKDGIKEAIHDFAYQLQYKGLALMEEADIITRLGNDSDYVIRKNQALNALEKATYALEISTTLTEETQHPQAIRATKECAQAVVDMCKAVEVIEDMRVQRRVKFIQELYNLTSPKESSTNIQLNASEGAVTSIKIVGPNE